ncbi:MAG: lysozyme [Okeania sp. SIO1H6]|nr:lysozyme [Okeania sp. SIO1H6]
MRYPNGKKVQLGERITERNAEFYLKYECDKAAEVVLRLVQVPLNQNQFDALVCFCYNVGTGAFESSTMLRKLN